MAINHTSLARPYARALFAEALEQGQVSEWQTQLDAFADAICSAEVQPIVRSRVISRERKLAAVTDSLGSDTMLANLSSLLVHNDRLEMAGEIARQYAALRRQHEQQQAVTVSTPYPLEKADLTQITQRLQERMGSKLVITTEIDPTLIAGMRITGQGWLIEGNMQAQLAQMTRQLVA